MSKFSFQQTHSGDRMAQGFPVHCSLGKLSPKMEGQQLKEKILQNKVLLGRIADILVSLLMHH